MVNSLKCTQKESKGKVELNAKDNARDKPTRLGHLLDVRAMGGKKERKVVFEVSSLAKWPAGDTMNQNKEVSRMWGKGLAGFSLKTKTK